MLEPCTANNLDEELDFKMWIIETMDEKTPWALENNSYRSGKQKK